jgi:ribosome maturation factor RimP
MPAEGKEAIMATAEKLERVIAPVVTSFGLELIDLEANTGHLRVTVDREGGVDLDTIGSATGAISRALDETDAMPGGRYELEVSSPGVERRLRRPEHFAAQVGARVAVKTKPGTEGERRVEGRLSQVSAHGFELVDESIAGGSRMIAFQEVERANTVFDWRAALAGTSAPSARKEHRARRRAATREGQGQRDVRHGTETR